MEIGRNLSEELRQPEYCTHEEYKSGIPARIHPSKLVQSEHSALRILLNDRDPHQAAIDFDTIITDVEYIQGKEMYKVGLLMKPKAKVVKRQFDFNTGGFIVTQEQGDLVEVGYLPGFSKLDNWNTGLTRLAEHTNPLAPVA